MGFRYSVSCCCSRLNLLSLLRDLLLLLVNLRLGLRILVLLILHGVTDGVAANAADTGGQSKREAARSCLSSLNS